MLFNSYIFLFGFLPAALLVFYGLRHRGFLNASVTSLMLASVAFYTYWRPSDTFILIGFHHCQLFCGEISGKAVRKALKTAPHLRDFGEFGSADLLQIL